MKRMFCFLLASTAVCCGIVEEDLSRRRIEIIGPSSGISVPEGAVVFRWHAVEKAAGYALTIATPSLGEGRIVADSVFLVDTLSARRYGCRLMLDAGEYEWMVSAFNSGSETRSGIQSLTVAAAESTEEPVRPDHPDTSAP